MQSSFLILMLALGLPGANSCNAQQQGLPRVGQAPPAPAAEQPKPEVVETADADDSDADDADDADEAEMDEMDLGEIAIELPEMDEFGAECPELPCQTTCETPCKTQAAPQCQGSGSCQAHSDSLLGSANGQTLHQKKPAKAKSLSLQPGSAVILQSPDGKVQWHTLQGNGLTTMSLDPASMPTLDHLFVAKAQGKASQDERVRELEQRVRELEAQLRARDENAPRGFARSYGAFGGQVEGERARAEAEAERAMARDLQAQVKVQARAYAEQARKQAEEIRAQSEQLRKRVQEQSKQWRVRTGEGARYRSAIIAEGGEPVIAVPTPPACTEVAPDPVCTPAPAAAPEAPAPPSGAWWSQGQGTPAPMVRTRMPGGTAAGAAPRMDDMRAMMDQMRAQMEEMREQMKALREELQNAPRRELR